MSELLLTVVRFVHIHYKFVSWQLLWSLSLSTVAPIGFIHSMHMYRLHHAFVLGEGWGDTYVYWYTDAWTVVLKIPTFLMHFSLPPKPPANKDFVQFHIKFYPWGFFLPRKWLFYETLCTHVYIYVLSTCCSRYLLMQPSVFTLNPPSSLYDLSILPVLKDSHH